MSELKISYCITCKGRLHHLKETLHKNLATANDPNVEFVVLDYDSQDGLENWMAQNFMREIQSGKIVYAKYSPAEHFKFGHAKNLGIRTSTGNVVCSLDADNIIAPGFTSWLRKEFSQDPNIIVRINNLGRYAMRATGRIDKGMGGRIAVSRETFFEIHGFDENFEGWAPDDTDFALRAMSYGIRPVAIPIMLLGSVLDHTDEERMAHTSDAAKARSLEFLQHHKERRSRSSAQKIWTKLVGDTDPQVKPSVAVANPSGQYGCGKLVINFTEITHHLPFPPAISLSKQSVELMSVGTRCSNISAAIEGLLRYELAAHYADGTMPIMDVAKAGLMVSALGIKISTKTISPEAALHNMQTIMSNPEIQRPLSCIKEKLALAQLPSSFPRNEPAMLRRTREKMEKHIQTIELCSGVEIAVKVGLSGYSPDCSSFKDGRAYVR